MQSLGTSGYRWNNLFAGALNLSGGATISGSIALVGQLQMQNDNITGVGHIIMSDFWIWRRC